MRKIRREEADAQQAARNRDRVRSFDPEVEAARREYTYALEEVTRRETAPAPADLPACPKHPNWKLPMRLTGQPLPPRGLCPLCVQEHDAASNPLKPEPDDEHEPVAAETLMTTAEFERMQAKHRALLERGFELDNPEPADRDSAAWHIWSEVRRYRRANPWVSIEAIEAYRESLALERIDERRAEVEKKLMQHPGGWRRVYTAPWPRGREHDMYRRPGQRSQTAIRGADRPFGVRAA